MALGTIPAVDTVHSAFDFSEPRCFQLEAPEMSNKDLRVGLQKREGLDLPQLEWPQPRAPSPNDYSSRQDEQNMCCASPTREYPRGTQHQGFPGREMER